MPKYARPNFNHLMVDLETLGVNPRAPILAIRAVLFCAKTCKTKKLAYYRTEPDLKLFQADMSTVRWWLGQSHEAQDALFKDVVPLKVALKKFAAAVLASKPEYVWGNAPSFDCTILRSAFAAYGIDCPWSFWQESDLRTMRQHVAGKLKVLRTSAKVAHDALSDATAQASEAAYVLRALGAL